MASLPPNEGLASALVDVRGATPPMRARRGSGSRSPGGLAWGLLVPALVIVGGVSIFPIGNAIYLSLHETSYMNVGEFSGLAHYREIFGSPRGWAAIGRSFLYVSTSLVIVIPLGIALAHLLNQPVPGRRVFRVLILLPWVISQTVAALIWQWLVNPDFGPLGFDDVLGNRIDILSHPVSAMMLLIVVNVWISYPLATILTLAALQSVPLELREAAEVDGAAPFRRLLQITLPLIKPTLTVIAIMLTLLYFNMVTLVYTLTGGGPLDGTAVLSHNAFQQSFEFFDLGVGSAYSVVLFAFNVVFGIAYVRLLRGETSE